jgi:hypothetical protein
MYRTADGTIYKVQKAVHGSGRMTAKRLVDGRDTKSGWGFVYAGLASRFVKADDKLSMDEAKRFGAVYGVCCVCAATLTDEASIEAGIGPVCASRI